MRKTVTAFAIALFLGTAATWFSAAAQQPAVVEWIDNFEGGSLDADKWEQFTFQGGSGGKIELKDGELRMRGLTGSRTGVRSQKTFASDRFIFEAALKLVSERIPEGGNPDRTGFAILAVLFNGSERNRIEWILRSDGRFEAWLVLDGRGEQLDAHNLGTKERNPTLAIVRRGDELFFMLNGEPGLQRKVPNLPKNFRVMVYGYGGTETRWDWARVVTME
jgi:hypothetical protein